MHNGVGLLRPRKIFMDHPADLVVTPHLKLALYSELIGIKKRLKYAALAYD